MDRRIGERPRGRRRPVGGRRSCPGHGRQRQPADGRDRGHRPEAGAGHPAGRHRDHRLFRRAAATAGRGGKHRAGADGAGGASVRLIRRPVRQLHHPRGGAERVLRLRRIAQRGLHRRDLHRPAQQPALRLVRPGAGGGAERPPGHPVRAQRHGRPGALRLAPADRAHRRLSVADLWPVQPGARGRCDRRPARRRPQRPPGRSVQPLRRDLRQQLPRCRRRMERQHRRRPPASAVAADRRVVGPGHRLRQPHRTVDGAVSELSLHRRLRRRRQCDQVRARGRGRDAGGHRARRRQHLPRLLLRARPPGARRRRLRLHRPGRRRLPDQQGFRRRRRLRVRHLWRDRAPGMVRAGVRRGLDQRLQADREGR